MEYRKQPVRSRSLDTINTILDATMDLLEKQGVESVSTNNIAKRAGFGVGTLYLYFEKKEQILLALIEREFNRQLTFFQEMFKKHPDSFEECVIRLLTTLLQDDQFLKMAMLINYLPLLENLTGNSKTSEKIKQIIFDNLYGVKSVDLSSDVKAEITAQVVYDLIRGILGSASIRHFPTEEDKQAYHKSLVQELMKILSPYLGQIG